MTRASLRTIGVALLAACSTSCALCPPKPAVHEPYVTVNGLWVRDLVIPPEGRVAAHGDLVTIDYTLRLEDGTLADSSQERGQSIEFRIGEGRVPAGLEEGLIGMRVLGRRKLRIPPELGYGSAGRPPRIPPDETLTIVMELLRAE